MRIFTLVLSIMICSFAASSAVYAAASEKPSGDMEYVKLDPLVLPVIDNDGVYQILSLVVVIEVGGIMDADKVKAKKYNLKDAYIQDMYGILSEHIAIKDGIIQIDIIKQRLNEVTSRIMADDEVETEVLLQVVEQRPI